MKTLILLAHPRLDRSETNAPLVEAARGVSGVSLVDLYAEYPGFEIDVDREQHRLLEHDCIVLQHPLYWYSAPAILKEWMDLVLEHGFAYGQDGHALDGKVAFNAVTAGAKRESYHPDGANGIELKGLLVPFEKSFHLCRMRYLAPYALFRAGHALDEGLLDAHVTGYARLLEALVDDTIDLVAAEHALTLSDDLDRFISPGEAW